MSALSLERRIDRLESRAEIEALIADYATACDDRDMDLLAATFTRDIVISSANGAMQASGLDQVMRMYNNLFAVRGPGFHWSHDRTIRFDDDNPDQASGLILAHAETCPDGQVSIAGIRYKDVYRRERGRWLFAERKLHFVYYLPMADFIERFPGVERVRMSGGWAEADYPENSESWKNWHKGRNQPHSD